jgi:hypothetical protein
VINGRGDTPNLHDVLTGSHARRPHHRWCADSTCRNWTSERTGRGDRRPPRPHRARRQSAPAKSWNSSHPSRGCSQDALKATGGAGLYYCFAAN